MDFLCVQFHSTIKQQIEMNTELKKLRSVLEKL